MRIMIRRQWRPRALNSVLGFMDIKTGVTVAILFALLNKVAGVYGLIAIFHGGTLAQLSMYIYSVIALAAFAWGIKVVTEEDAQQTFYFAHIFLGDHLLNTIWTAFFAIVWWYHNPHDGKRIANSDAQKDMMGSGSTMSDEDRKTAAQLIWNQEKGTAAMVLLVGWFFKIYFTALIYSYAIHLRKGSYHSLPLSNPVPELTVPYGFAPAPGEEYEIGDEEREFYQMPVRGGASPSALSSSSRSRRGAPSGLRLSSRIVQDLEAPTESVLWDEEEGEEEASGRLPSAKGTLKTDDDAKTYTTEDSSDMDGDGDITSSATRQRAARPAIP